MKVLALICLLATVGYVSAYQSCQSGAYPDLVLVVEDSSKIPAGDGEQKLKDFLAEIANNFNLGADVARVAYARYNATPTTMFNLNRYDQTSNAKSAILTAAFARGEVAAPAPLISDALTYTWTNMLRVTNGERSCHPTVVVLVSFSQYPDGNSGASPVDPVLIANDFSAVRLLKNSGALIITVGVGPERSPKHLLELASDPHDVYYHDFELFDDLNDDAADAIATQACAYLPDGRFFPCEMKAVQADIVFVVDVSANFANNDALRPAIVDFMNNTLSPYNYDHVTGVQAALVTYQKDGDIQINFDHFTDPATDNLENFLGTADAALAKSCGQYTERCVEDALDKVSRYILSTTNARYRQNCTIHQVYIFTSDCFNCGDPIPYANGLRTSTGTPNTQIFVVPLIYGLPNNGFWKEYMEIADDASHLWEAQPDPVPIVQDYLHKQAWRAVCRAFYGNPPTVPAVRCPPTPLSTTVAPPPESTSSGSTTSNP